ncbi:MAG: type II toxin-antitoxin system RelB/DinJ family antitoxin [Coriobacteriales bacterium]|nr:type II toxin-antitoxin system RelB/DinJ family antitoxin [Coriobacteriales bacterium]
MPTVQGSLADTALSTQMNTRIDRALKNQGDTVFARYGITSSQAIRSLWQYAASHDDIPDYLKHQLSEIEDQKKKQFKALVQKGSGLALRLAVEENLVSPDVAATYILSPVDDDKLQDEMYEAMLDEYHASCDG